MSAVPKKTQQDKFQTVLVNLLKEEENKYCADCESKGPRWASWNLGIFLCIRCAGIHRNLGVHISRVKSVNLDSWTPEQLFVMMEIGNGKAKVAYEANLPENFRRPLTDSSLEQFIRQKYEQRKYTPTGWQPPRVNVRAELLENAPVTSLTGRGDRPSTGSKSSTGTRAARAKKDASSGIGAIPAVPSAPIGLNRIADQASDVGVGARTHTLSSSSSELSTPHNAAQPQPQAQTQPAIQGDLLVSLDDTFGDLVSAPPPQQPAMTPYFATAPATVPAPAAPAPAATTSVDDLQAVFSAPPVSYSGAPSAPSGTASESGANWSSNGNASASSMTNSAILALYGIGAAKPQNGQAFGQTSSVSPASVQQQLAGLNFGAPAASGGWPPASASGTAVRPNPFGFGIPEQTASGSGSVSTATGGGQTLISDLWH